MGLPKDNMFFGYADKLTGEQHAYIDSIYKNQLTFVDSPSGTGKTFIAVAVAKLLGKPLFYTFSPVEEGVMGYTPGDQELKESKYIQPLLDALDTINEDPRFALKRNDNPDLINNNAWVEAKSHVFLRGTNIIDKFLILEEAQNMTRGEFKKILTRVHSNTKVVVIGHHMQCDLKDPTKSGFLPYIEHFKDEPYVGVIKLTKNFRSPLAQHADKLEW